MPRAFVNRARGHYYHVMTKTNNDEFRLVEHDDILVLEAFIAVYKHLHKIKIFSYCIMSNHLHFLVQNSNNDDEAMSLFLRDVKREFAKYYNIAYGKKGSFWKERSTIKEITSDTQFVNTLVYILNNPVNARKCDLAWEYAFGSFPLALTKASYKSLKQTKEFLSLENATELIKKAKKEASYACRLPQEERLSRGLSWTAETFSDRRKARYGKKDYKLRGPYSYRHEYNPHCKVNDISRTFTTSITDVAPKSLSLGSKSIRELCLIRSNSHEDPFKADGMTVIFESESRKACYRYQEEFFDSIPVGAQQPHSVIQSNFGTWQLVVTRGRPLKNAI